MRIMNVSSQTSLDLQPLKEMLEDHDLMKYDFEIVFIDASQKQDCWEVNYNTNKDLKYPGDDSFRAFCIADKDCCWVFVDEYETTASLYWVAIHEFVHWALWQQMLLKYFFSYKRDIWLESIGLTYDEYIKQEIQTQDHIHENAPEEVFCNEVATQFIGYRYDRKWWREQQEHQNKTLIGA